MKSEHVIDYGQHRRYEEELKPVNCKPCLQWYPLCPKHHAIEQIKQQPFFSVNDHKPG